MKSETKQVKPISQRNFKIISAESTLFYLSVRIYLVSKNQRKRYTSDNSIFLFFFIYRSNSEICRFGFFINFTINAAMSLPRTIIDSGMQKKNTNEQFIHFLFFNSIAFIISLIQTKGTKHMLIKRLAKVLANMIGIN